MLGMCLPARRSTRIWLLVCVCITSAISSKTMRALGERLVFDEARAQHAARARRHSQEVGTVAGCSRCCDLRCGVTRTFVAAGADKFVRFTNNTASRRPHTLALTRLCFAPSALYLWLLDEPNSGLDSAGHKAFEAILATHQDAGGLSVLASHHLLDSRLTPRYLDLSDEMR